MGLPNKYFISTLLFVMRRSTNKRNLKQKQGSVSCCEMNYGIMINLDEQIKLILCSQQHLAQQRDEFLF